MNVVSCGGINVRICWAVGKNEGWIARGRSIGAAAVESNDGWSRREVSDRMLVEGFA
jgi:hypothetical protein